PRAGTGRRGPEAAATLRPWLLGPLSARRTRGKPPLPDLPRRAAPPARRDPRRPDLATHLPPLAAMPSADAPSLAVAAIAAKACLPRPRHIGRTASGATFQVCRSLSGPVDREARSFASVIGAPRSMPRADSGAPRPQFTNSRPGERHLAPWVGATTVWRVLSLSGVSCPSPRA